MARGIYRFLNPESLAFEEVAMKRSMRRLVFTLVKLLVVIAIIGILIGMLLQLFSRFEKLRVERRA